MKTFLEQQPTGKWIVIAALMFGAAAAGCEHRRHTARGHDDVAGRVERMAKHVDDVLDEIDATPEQRRSIHATLDPLFEQARGFEGTRDTLRGAYHAAWQASTFDAAKLNALLNKEADKLVLFSRAMTEAMAEVHAVLSPEQREKIAAHVGSHRRR